MTKYSLRRTYFVLAGFLVTIIMSLTTLQIVSAASFTWDGDTDTDLSTAANWVGDTAPSGGDTMIFDVSTYDFDANTLTNDFAADTDFEIQVTGAETDVVTITGVNAIDLRDDAGADGVAVSTTGGGSLVINVATTLIGEVDATTGAVTFGAAVTLSGDSSFTPTSAAINVGALDFGANAFVVNDGTGMANFSGIVTGSGTFDTDNTTGITLDGANTFTGAFDVGAGGIVHVGNVAAFGTTAADTTLASGSQLLFDLLDTSDAVIAENITVGDGLGTAGDEAAFYIVHVSAVPDPFVGDTPDKGDLDFTGTVTLTEDSTFFAEPFYYSNSTVTFATLDGATFELAQVAGSGAKLVKTAGDSDALPDGSKTATTPVADDPAVFNVLPNDVLTVNTGITLGDVNVVTGGVLMGNGTVGAVNMFGGSFAPGLSPGCMSTGNLAFTAGSSLDAELQGTTACTGYDQIQVTGTVDVTGATLNVSHLGGFLAAASDAFTLISNDAADAVTGTFTGLAEGATFVVDGVTFAISYVGGDGNDVVITAAAAATTPAAPDTGFGPITLNYVTVFIVTILASGTLFTLAYLEDRKKKIN